VRRIGHAKDDLLGDLLDGQGHVHVGLRDLGLGLAPRQIEERLENVVAAHGQAGGVVEGLHVQQKRSVLAQVHELIEDDLAILPGARGIRVAVGRQAHELVLARVDLEARIVSEGGV